MIFVSLLLAAAATGVAPKPTLGIVVMDPLCKRLACACVQGYAQRDYEALGRFLSVQLDQPIRMIYSDDLAKALGSARRTKVVAIVGKFSVVAADSVECRVKVRPVGMIAGEDGSTTITGWFVVRKSDSARTLANLKGRRIFFGPKDNEEKYDAALAALDAAGVPRPTKIETRPGCSDAALAMLESKDKPAPAALISSYAAALIEGCGTVPKGALRVVGKTAPVPFVTVFATGSLDEAGAVRLSRALVDMGKQHELLKAMETKGFVPSNIRAETFAASVSTGWPGWRGPNRDGIVPTLPSHLPVKPRVIWRQPLTGDGMAGVAVSDGYVIVPDRDAADRQDVFRCFRASDGAFVWKHAYATAGRLDYGNGPRATPQVGSGKAYLLGAFGGLHCVELATGKVVWQHDLCADFGAKPPTWGYTGSPLIVGGALIVSPGAKDSSVVALDRDTGAVLWRCPGPGASYSSFVTGNLGGREQVVGYDAVSLGGWDSATGKRLWTLKPPTSGDFNIGTPIVHSGRLLVSTENNGTRLYSFADDGVIVPKPAAVDEDLAMDTATPTMSGSRVLGCRGEIYCLDSSLKPIWTGSDPAYKAHVSLIASEDRALIATYRGELLLVATNEPSYRLLSRVRVSPADRPFYSHPALVGDRLYLRDATGISCLSLAE